MDKEGAQNPGAGAAHKGYLPPEERGVSEKSEGDQVLDNGSPH